MLNRIRAYLSECLSDLALRLEPDDEVYFVVPDRSKPGYTPPLSKEANARTKRTKAKRKRRLERLRKFERAQKLEARE